MSDKKILVINCGSSSLKYQLFIMNENKGERLAKGNVERIGEKDSFLVHEKENGESFKEKVNIKDHTAAFKVLIEAILDEKKGVLKNKSEIDGVAHRVVHGGEKYKDSVLITQEVYKDIEELSDLAPLHNPANLQGIKASIEALPGVPNTATFDTSFHQTIPDYSYMYAIPYEIYEKFKIRRYGFHGTSHRYVASKAVEFCKMAKENTNLITAHLGNGCSITAIAQGKSIDTSMGFTPLEGLIMGTRSGDIDPAIIHYLTDKGYTDKEIINILNKKSGLIGLSGLSNDLRDLEKAAAEGNERAKLALNAFAYRIRKYIGAYSAVMVKVNILVFTGGIGQHSVLMREMITKNLENIGYVLDRKKNKQLGSKMGIISTDYSPVTMLVIPTDEEKGMAEDCFKLLFQ